MSTYLSEILVQERQFSPFFSFRFLSTKPNKGIFSISQDPVFQHFE